LNEKRRAIAVHARLGKLGEEVTHQVEELGVGRGVRAWRSADRALVDVDHLVDLGQPFDPFVRSDRQVASVKRARERG